MFASCVSHRRRAMAASALAVTALVATVLWTAVAEGAARNVFSSSGDDSGTSAFNIAIGGAITLFSGPVPNGGSGSRGVALTPDGSTVYVVNGASDNVSIFDAATDGSLTLQGGTVNTGDTQPQGVAVTPDGHHAYVTNLGGNSLSQFDIASDGSITLGDLTPEPTGGNDPYGVAITPDGRHAYVANDTGGLSRIDIATDGSLTANGTVATLGTNPRGIAITPDGHHAYVAHQGSSDLSRFDIAADGSITHAGSNVATGGSNAQGVAITPDGHHAYVTNKDSDDLSRFDIAANGSITQVAPTVVTNGTDPFGVAVSPNGRQAYVGNMSGTLSRFDIAANGAITQVDTPTSGGTLPNFQSVAIRPDQAPAASFTVAVGTTNRVVHFNASASSDSDGLGIARYDWNFGDGQTLPNGGPTPTHTYATGGPRTASLTVTDGAGTSTSKVFTGQTMSRNGGPTAQTTRSVAVPALVPVAKKSVVVDTESGTVTIKLPGSSKFVPLTSATGIPVGSIVDATKGRVTLTAVDEKGKPQVMTFYEGIFQVRQSTSTDGLKGSKRHLYTEARMVGGDFSVCKAKSKRSRAATIAARKRRKVRHLWGKGKGRFRTRGKHSAGTVRGTTWLTEDRCDGTRTKVLEGRVAVRDFKRRKTVLVKARHSYLAKAKR